LKTPLNSPAPACDIKHAGIANLHSSDREMDSLLMQVSLGG
jgi:hypothetical protein